MNEITIKDFHLMGFQENERKLKLAANIVNNYYKQKKEFTSFYNEIEKSNKYPLDAIILAKNFHKRFINEMFDG